MRSLWTILLLSLAAIMSQAQTFDQPVDYSNFFAREFTTLQDLQIAYHIARAYKSEAQAEAQMEIVRTRIQEAYKRISNCPTYPNDQGLRADALRTVEIMRNMSAKDYHQMAVEYTGCDECFPALLQQSKLHNKDHAELSKAMKQVVTTMKSFAEVYNIRLIDNREESNKLLHKINKLNDYLEEFTLAVSEVRYADGAVIDALNERDPKAGIIAAETLLKAANNAMERLSKVQRLPNDEQFLATTRKLIDTYRKAAQYVYPKMMSYIDEEGNIINDKVDAYNESIEVLNKNVQALNQAFENGYQRIQQQQLPQPKE